MLNIRKSDFNYDKKYDVLNIKVCDQTNSIGHEEFDNVILFKDVISNSITGLMILDFLDEYNDNLTNLNHIKNEYLLNIDFEYIEKNILNSK